MPARSEVPVWLAIAAPLVALLASMAATALVIKHGWLDAVCDGALRGHRAAEIVETCWCDLRGAGRESLRSLTG